MKGCSFQHTCFWLSLPAAAMALGLALTTAAAAQSLPAQSKTAPCSAAPPTSKRGAQPALPRLIGSGGGACTFADSKRSLDRKGQGGGIPVFTEASHFVCQEFMSRYISARSRGEKASGPGFGGNHLRGPAGNLPERETQQPSQGQASARNQWFLVLPENSRPFCWKFCIPVRRRSSNRWHNHDFGFPCPRLRVSGAAREFALDAARRFQGYSCGLSRLGVDRS